MLKKLKRCFRNLTVQHSTSASLRQVSVELSYLQQEIGGVVNTHDQAAHAHHVIYIWETDQTDRGQMMNEHNEKILRKRTRNTFQKYIEYALGKRDIKVMQIKCICITNSPKTKPINRPRIQMMFNSVKVNLQCFCMCVCCFGSVTSTKEFTYE